MKMDGLKKGWNGKAIWFGSFDNEPVVHINFNEAENYCKWNKKRIPTLKEWELARILSLD